ncbi:cyclic peptide export ABC transporter [Paenibacillus filicis]|uniref:Beta-lactamase n=1 Tax=Paenibacillus filicis TaxID=669464 RepID=A0ABU9DGN1_9BACL
MGLWLMLAAIVACLLPPAVVWRSPAAPAWSGQDTEAVERIIAKSFEGSEIPGLSVVIVKGRDTVYNKGFGFADKAARIPMTTDRLFELGSMSKAFTAMAVLKLSREGLLKLDEPVTAYLPWLTFTYKHQPAVVTLRQLLHHTSGIAPSTIGELPELQGEDALEKSMRVLAGSKLLYKPGNQFVYATVNYDILGLIMQQATGVPYASYIRQHILQPLGMNHTYVGREGVPEGQMSRGYKQWFTQAKAYDAPYYGGNVPAAYVVTSSEDYAQWIKLQLGTAEASGDLRRLALETQQANRTVPPFGDGSSYAMGWNVLQLGGGQLFHDGNNPNFFSSVILRPEEQLGVAVFSNLETYLPQKIANDIVNHFTGREEAFSYFDNYARLDKVGAMILIGCVPFIGVLLYLNGASLAGIVRRRRKFAGLSLARTGSVLLLSAVTAVFFYCLTYVPRVYLNGSTWSAMVVYTPDTLHLGMYAIGGAAALFYLYYVLQLLFPQAGKTSYFLMSVLSLASGFGNALIVFTVNDAVSTRAKIGFQQPIQTANNLLLYFLFGIVLYVVGQRVLRPILIRLANDLIYSKRTEIVAKLLRISYQDMEKIKRERIESTLNNDTEAISNIVNLIVSGLTSMITLVFCFIYLGLINALGLLISMGVLLLAAVMYYFVGKKANALWEQTRDIQNTFFRYINDLVRGFKELALNRGKRRDFQADFNESCEEYRLKRAQGDINFAMVFIIGELLFVMVLGVIGFLFPLLFDNAFSFVRDYVFVFIYMVGPINMILASIPQFAMVRISWRRIQALNAELDEVLSGIGSDAAAGQLASVELTADAVEFEYETSDGHVFAVGPLSATFRSGQITFITGGNGSGKSTFAKLLTGLYQPSRGQMLLNGRPAGPGELNELFSAIFSDVHLFSRLYGIDWTTKEEDIRHYLKVLQLEDKVTLKEGRFSHIELSTGQRKRLALLISYLEERPVYLLDEWAADQDPEYRKFFYHTLLPELRARGTCIIAITHDDMYFHLADQLIKLDFGQIVQQPGQLQVAAAYE